MKKQKQTPKYLPFGTYLGIMVCLALFGLCVSIYLSISHYRVYTDIGYRSFCAVSKAVNCDTVSQSSYSILLGIPLGVWGIVGYLVVFMLLFLAWGKEAEKKRVWSTLFGVCLGYSIYSIVLALISSIVIHAYCIMCLLTYLVNFLLTYYAWLTHQRFDHKGIVIGLAADLNFFRRYKAKIGLGLLSILVPTAMMMAWFPVYWDYKPPQLESSFMTGLTTDNHPWIGASNPSIEITEFSDYQCFQCRKMHSFLRMMVAKYPNQLRLIHRHFPMDQSINPLVKEAFHDGSGNMALMAIHAAEKGKFWEMNDLLFNMVAEKKNDLQLEEIAQKTGLDSKEIARAIANPMIRQKLLHEIRDGLKLGIDATPGFVINGKVYIGEIPPEILKEIFG